MQHNSSFASLIDKNIIGNIKPPLGEEESRYKTKNQSKQKQ